MGSDLSVVLQTCATSPDVLWRRGSPSSSGSGQDLGAVPHYVELRLMSAAVAVSFVSAAASRGSTRGSFGGLPGATTNRVFLLVPSCSAYCLGGSGGGLDGAVGEMPKSPAYGELRVAAQDPRCAGRFGLVVDPSVQLGERLQSDPRQCARFTQGLSQLLANVLTAAELNSGSRETSSLYLVDLRDAHLSDGSGPWVVRDLTDRACRARNPLSSSSGSPSHDPASTSARCDRFCASLQHVLLTSNTMSAAGVVNVLKLLTEGVEKGAAAVSAVPLLPSLQLVDLRGNGARTSDLQPIVEDEGVCCGEVAIMADDGKLLLSGTRSHGQPPPAGRGGQPSAPPRGRREGELDDSPMPSSMPLRRGNEEDEGTFGEPPTMATRSGVPEVPRRRAWSPVNNPLSHNRPRQGLSAYSRNEEDEHSGSGGRGGDQGLDFSDASQPPSQRLDSARKWFSDTNRRLEEQQQEGEQQRAQRFLPSSMFSTNSMGGDDGGVDGGPSMPPPPRGPPPPPAVPRRYAPAVPRTRPVSNGPPSSRASTAPPPRPPSFSGRLSNSPPPHLPRHGRAPPPEEPPRPLPPHLLVEPKTNLENLPQRTHSSSSDSSHFSNASAEGGPGNRTAYKQYALGPLIPPVQQQQAQRVVATFTPDEPPLNQTLPPPPRDAVSVLSGMSSAAGGDGGEAAFSRNESRNVQFTTPPRTAKQTPPFTEVPLPPSQTGWVELASDEVGNQSQLTQQQQQQEEGNSVNERQVNSPGMRPFAVLNPFAMLNQDGSPAAAPPTPMVVPPVTSVSNSNTQATGPGGAVPGVAEPAPPLHMESIVNESHRSDYDTEDDGGQLHLPRKRSKSSDDLIQHEDPQRRASRDFASSFGGSNNNVVSIPTAVPIGALPQPLSSDAVDSPSSMKRRGTANGSASARERGGDVPTSRLNGAGEGVNEGEGGQPPSSASQSRHPRVVVPQPEPMLPSQSPPRYLHEQPTQSYEDEASANPRGPPPPPQRFGGTRSPPNSGRRKLVHSQPTSTHSSPSVVALEVAAGEGKLKSPVMVPRLAVRRAKAQAARVPPDVFVADRSPNRHKERVERSPGRTFSAAGAASGDGATASAPPELRPRRGRRQMNIPALDSRHSSTSPPSPLTAPTRHATRRLTADGWLLGNSRAMEEEEARVSSRNARRATEPGPPPGVPLNTPRFMRPTAARLASAPSRTSTPQQGNRGDGDGRSSRRASPQTVRTGSGRRQATVPCPPRLHTSARAEKREQLRAAREAAEAEAEAAAAAEVDLDNAATPRSSKVEERVTYSSVAVPAQVVVRRVSPANRMVIPETSPRFAKLADRGRGEAMESPTDARWGRGAATALQRPRPATSSPPRRPYQSSRGSPGNRSSPLSRSSPITRPSPRSAAAGPAASSPPTTPRDLFGVPIEAYLRRVERVANYRDRHYDNVPARVSTRWEGGGYGPKTPRPSQNEQEPPEPKKNPFKAKYDPAVAARAERVANYRDKRYDNVSPRVTSRWEGGSYGPPTSARATTPPVSGRGTRPEAAGPASAGRKLSAAERVTTPRANAPSPPSGRQGVPSPARGGGGGVRGQRLAVRPATTEPSRAEAYMNRPSPRGGRGSSPRPAWGTPPSSRPAPGGGSPHNRDSPRGPRRMVTKADRGVFIPPGDTLASRIRRASGTRQRHFADVEEWLEQQRRWSGRPEINGWVQEKGGTGVALPLPATALPLPSMTGGEEGAAAAAAAGAVRGVPLSSIGAVTPSQGGLDYPGPRRTPRYVAPAPRPKPMQLMGTQGAATMTSTAPPTLRPVPGAPRGEFAGDRGVAGGFTCAGGGLKLGVIYHEPPPMGNSVVSRSLDLNDGNAANGGGRLTPSDYHGVGVMSSPHHLNPAAVGQPNQSATSGPGGSGGSPRLGFSASGGGGGGVAVAAAAAGGGGGGSSPGAHGSVERRGAFPVVAAGRNSPPSATTP